MNILISGIHGYIGSHLVECLSLNHNIYGLSRSTIAIPGVEKIFLWSELHDTALPQIDVIIHLAAEVSAHNRGHDDNVAHDVSCHLARQIFDYFTASQAHTFIHFSSIAAVNDTACDGVVTENTRPAPSTSYALCKGLVENELTRQIPKLTAQGKQLYILRPSMVYGSEGRGNLQLLFSFVRKGLPWPLAAFENKRTFTALDNLTFVVTRLLSTPIPSGIYNVCDDDALATNDLIIIIGEVLGRKVTMWHINKQFIKALAHIGGWFHLYLNPMRLSKLTGNLLVSNGKIKKALAIDRMPIEAHEAMKKSIATMAQQYVNE